MKNKKLLILVIFFSGNLSFAEYLSFNKEINGTNAIFVPSGEKWKIVSYSLPNNIEVFTSTNRTTRIGILTSTAEQIWGGEGFAGSASGITIVGPAVIWVGNTSSYYFAVDKKPASDSGVYQSFSSVVIPTSASGDVDVKMEQSADNVTWTECLPGTYNSSTVKRFFRLRAVEK